MEIRVSDRVRHLRAFGMSTPVLTRERPRRPETSTRAFACATTPNTVPLLVHGKSPVGIIVSKQRIESIRLVTAVAAVMVAASVMLGTVQAGPAQYDGWGNMSVTQTGTSISVGWNPTTNSSHPECDIGGPKWFTGDVFTFTDNWTIDNTAGSVPLTAAFTLDLYQWVSGSPGNLIVSDSATPPAVPQGQTATGTLTVVGNYNGWNGNPACELSFHVYRHAGSPNPGNARSDWY